MKVYPNGAAEPAQSNLYWTAGETHAAMVIVPVDANGNIRLENMSAGTTHLIVDVQGYFTPTPDATPNALQTVDPTRIVSTLTSSGTCSPNCNRFTAGAQKTIQIAGGVVPAGATAASITITAVNGSAGGWLEAAPDGSFVQGAASVVNYGAGENVANSAIIKLPANGKIVVYSSQAVDVIIDVTGYFTAPLATYGYTYDGDGLRRTKTWYGIGATYRYSLAEGLPIPIEENVFGGLLRTSYIYGPGGLPIEQITELNGSVTSKVWFHHDQLGSTRVLTDENGNWRTKYAFDPYGNTAAVDTNPAYATVTTPLQYAGQLTDAETGMQYLRARYYDPATGRFLTRDPLSRVSGQPYGYAGNSPTNYIDPSGLLFDDWSIDLPGGWCIGTSDDCENPHNGHETSVSKPVVDFASGVLDVNPITATTNALGWTDTSQYGDECSGWYRAGQVSMVAAEVAMGVGLARQSTRLGDVAYRSRLFGADSYLFGSQSLGTHARIGGGLLNPAGRGAWRRGWSVHGTPVFRLKAAGNYVDLLVTSGF